MPMMNTTSTTSQEDKEERMRIWLVADLHLHAPKVQNARETELLTNFLENIANWPPSSNPSPQDYDELFRPEDIRNYTKAEIALDELDSVMAPGDILVVAGDISNNGRILEFLAACRLFQNFRGRCFIVSGNHDVTASGNSFIRRSVQYKLDNFHRLERFLDSGNVAYDQNTHPKMSRRKAIPLIGDFYLMAVDTAFHRQSGKGVQSRRSSMVVSQLPPASPTPNGDAGAFSTHTPFDYRPSPLHRDASAGGAGALAGSSPGPNGASFDPNASIGSANGGAAYQLEVPQARASAMARGRVGALERGRLEEEIAGISEKLESDGRRARFIIYMHHHPVDKDGSLSGGTMTKLKDAKEFAQLLAKINGMGFALESDSEDETESGLPPPAPHYRRAESVYPEMSPLASRGGPTVPLVLFGHDHEEYALGLNKVFYYCAPSLTGNRLGKRERPLSHFTAFDLGFGDYNGAIRVEHRVVRG